MSLSLQPPFDQQQRHVSEHIPILVVDIGPHDEVDQPFLVFEHDEHMPFGRVPSQPFRLAQCLRRVIGIEATYSPQHGAWALRTYGLTDATTYRYGLINRHLPAPAFPVRRAAFDVVFSYRGM